jgi:MoaA/NifB/PqqE/SkfB family radical SAM enzyme
MTKIISLDLTNRCPNRCPGCIRQDNDYVNNGRDLTEREMDMISDYYDVIEFCGTVSDPTTHPDFFNLLRICTAKNKKVQIHVAASHQSDRWWYKAFLFSKHKNVCWVFGIDGLPKDSHKYRVNQDGEKLFKKMVECSKFGIKTVWQYIVFNYNENDIEACKKIAHKHSIEFMLIKSCRYNFTNTVGKTMYHNNPKNLKPSDDWISSGGRDQWFIFYPEKKDMRLVKTSRY